MGLQRFQSRFCAFEGPSEWGSVPGLGLVDGDEHETRRSAVVTECWQQQTGGAAGFVEAQREAMRLAGSEAVVESQQALAVNGLSDCQLLTVRSPKPEGSRALLQKQLIAVEGPLACTLTVSGLEQDQDLWQELCNPMLGSFQVEAIGWAATIVEQELVSAPSRAGSGEMVGLAGLGLSIPVIDGWRLDEHGLLRDQGSAAVRFSRTGLAAGSAEECFAEALSRLADSGCAACAWHSGTTSRGASFWALEAVAQTDRAWGGPERMARREVFVDDQGVIAFTLDHRSRESAPAEALTVLGELVEGYEWLPVDQQELRLHEAWLPASLTGAWIVGGPGVYVCADPPGLAVIVKEIARQGSLGELLDSSASRLMSLPEVQRVVDDQRLEGKVDGCETRFLSLDYQSHDRSRASVRLCLLEAPRARLAVEVRAPDPEPAQRLMRELITSFLADATPGNTGSSR